VAADSWRRSRCVQRIRGGGAGRWGPGGRRPAARLLVRPSSSGALRPPSSLSLLPGGQRPAAGRSSGLPLPLLVPLDDGARRLGWRPRGGRGARAHFSREPATPVKMKESGARAILPCSWRNPAAGIVTPKRSWRSRSRRDPGAAAGSLTAAR
jgi:hypothetical protein